MDLSSRLEGVAWARLEHAHGDATDLPALLWRIGVTEHPDEVFGMLRDRLVHQGAVVYTAAVEVVPILVAMVSEEDCSARPAIVGLIGDIAREAARVGSEQAAKARWSRMWHGELPLMAALLCDDDVEVRRVAPALLASAESDQDRFLELLLRACAAERDDPAQLGQLTAVADLLPTVSAATKGAAVGRVAEIVSDASPQVRMAGAFVLRQAEPVGVGVFLDALRAPDVEEWRRTWCVRGRRRSIVFWVDDRLRDDRDLRLGLGRGLLASADVATRAAALRILMRVASKWRSPMAEVAAAGFHALDDPDEAVRDLALFALAVSRSREREHAERLAGLAGGPAGYQRLAAIWGLARTGDSRCAPHLLTSLRSADLGYPRHPVNEGSLSRPVLPSIGEILLAATAWSGTLLPGVVRRLASVSTDSERRELLRAVAGWGPLAEATLPVLVEGLTRPDPTLEIIALAAIGAKAPDVPIELLRPAFERVSAMPGVDRLERIRAYVRISADFGPVLAELPDAGSDGPLSDSALRLVGVLGSAGADYVGRLEQQMPGLGRWATLGAARSHWEITGEVEPAGRALTRFLGDLASGRPAVNADLLALRLIAEMGFIDPALVSVSRFLAGAEVRATGPVEGWHGIDLDVSLAEIARLVLDAA